MQKYIVLNPITLFCLCLQTSTADVLLMLASSESPSPQFLSLALDSEGILRVGVNDPNLENNVTIEVDQVVLDSVNSAPLNNLEWHHIKLKYILDKGSGVLWDPELYFGDSPNLNSGTFFHA